MESLTPLKDLFLKEVIEYIDRYQEISKNEDFIRIYKRMKKQYKEKIENNKNREDKIYTLEVQSPIIL
jgi:adenine-specific DNA methylase